MPVTRAARTTTSSTTNLNAYYNNLVNGLNADLVIPLEDTNLLAKSIVGDTCGIYTGTYSQQQSSLLSSTTAKSVQFNSGAIGVNYQFNDPRASTVACRFIASSTATGALFGFSSNQGYGGNPSSDRQVYLSGNNLRLRLYTGSDFLLTTPNGYRDNQPHTLVARFGGGLNTIISIDGVIVATASPQSPQSYAGYLKIGYAENGIGFATGLTLAGFGLWGRALTDTQVQSIHVNV